MNPEETGYDYNRITRSHWSMIDSLLQDNTNLYKKWKETEICSSVTYDCPDRWLGFQRFMLTIFRVTNTRHKLVS